MSDELEKEVINFLNKCSLPFDNFSQLDGMLIFRDKLLDTNIYEKIKPEIQGLKKTFCSSRLTCLQDTAETNQKWPLLNLVRQILKANDYKMEPIRKSNGYSKDGKKLYKRYFAIRKLKSVDESEDIKEIKDSLDNSKNNEDLNS